MKIKTFDYHHIVTFEETNLVGNVYFSNYFRWQGQCREAFLRKYMPEILTEFKKGTCFFTTSSKCDFKSELFAFDEITIRMSLSSLRPKKAKMTFKYFKFIKNDKGELKEKLVAEGEQGFACIIRHKDGTIEPSHFPKKFYDVLLEYKQ